VKRRRLLGALAALAHQLLAPTTRTVLGTTSALDAKLAGLAGLNPATTATSGARLAREMLRYFPAGARPPVIAGDGADGAAAAARAIVGAAGRDYKTRDEVRADVFDYIERFYNPKRRHQRWATSARYNSKSTIRLTEASVESGECQQARRLRKRLGHLGHADPRRWRQVRPEQLRLLTTT
jgi:hypothetical protein